MKNFTVISQAVAMTLVLYVVITSLQVRFNNPALSETQILIETYQRISND